MNDMMKMMSQMPMQEGDQMYGMQESPEVEELANQGRGTDTEMAHTSEMEMHIPKEIWMEYPEFLTKLKKIFSDKGYDYRQFIDGSGFEKRNPDTGAKEFGVISNFIEDVKEGGKKVVKEGKRVIEQGKNLPNRAMQNPYMNYFMPMNATKSFLQGAQGYQQGGLQGAMQGAMQPFMGAYGPMMYAPMGGIPGMEGQPGQGTGQAQSQTEEIGGLKNFLAKKFNQPTGLAGMTGEQQRSYLATKGTSGGGLGGDEQGYYNQLMARQIQGGGQMSPIEQEYMSQYGSNPTEQLAALSVM